MKNTLLITAAFGVLIGLLNSKYAMSAELVHNDSFVAKIGQGYDLNNQRMKANCLKPDFEIEGPSQASLGIVTEISSEQLAKELGISAGTKYRTGATKTSASASFYRNSKKSSNSISFIYRQDVSFAPKTLKSYQWTEIAKDLLRVVKDEGANTNTDEWQGVVEPKNMERFVSKCGTEFVDRQKLGARFYYSIRMDFASSNDHNRVTADFDFSSPTTDISANFKNELKKISKRSKVSINVLQIGGRVDLLGSVFGSDVQADDSGVKAFRQCSYGKLEECGTLIEKAIKYAVDTKSGFASQIDPSATEPGSGPAIISSFTIRYADVTGLESLQSPQTDRLLLEKRKSLISRFDKLLEHWIQAERMRETGIPRLSVLQANQRARVQSMALAELDVMTENLDVCYKDDLMCKNLITPDYLERVDKNIVAFKETLSSLKNPERFASMCDLLMAGDLPKQEAITVQAIYDSVDKCVTDEDSNQTYCPVEQSADRCLAAENEISSTENFDLSGKKIRSLKALKYLSHAVSINLSSNRIQSSELKELGVLKNIENLNLSKNNIRNIQSLPELTSLLGLDLSNNKLGTVKELKAFSDSFELDYLIITGNRSSIECPYPLEDGICIGKDYARYTSFSASPRSNYRRSGSKLIDLNKDYILIAGGVGKTNLEVMNKHTTEIRDLKIKSIDSHESTYTKLRDNIVFAFGGINRLADNAAVLLRFDKQGNWKGPQIVDYKGPAIHSHEAILLKDGRVLITGGFIERMTDQAVAYAYIYDPIQAKVFPISSMMEARVGHKLVLRDDGKVLVIGGFSITAGHFQGKEVESDTHGTHAGNGDSKRNSYAYMVPSNSIEIFDPTNLEFSWFSDRLHEKRYGHDAIKLDNGEILIVGGFNQAGSPELDTVESKLESKISAVSSSEIIGLDGRVRLLESELNSERAHLRLSKLSTGEILVLGGTKYSVYFVEDQKHCYTCIKTAEIFDPNRETFTELSSRMISTRVSFDITPLDSKRIFILGGVGNSGVVNEIFSYGGD